jgi:hypothetical protein
VAASIRTAARAVKSSLGEKDQTVPVEAKTVRAAKVTPTEINPRKRRCLDLLPIGLSCAEFTREINPVYNMLWFARTVPNPFVLLILKVFCPKNDLIAALRGKKWLSVPSL